VLTNLSNRRPPGARRPRRLHEPQIGASSSRVGYRVAGLTGRSVSIAVPARSRPQLRRGARLAVQLTVTASNGARVTRTATVRRARGSG